MESRTGSTQMALQYALQHSNAEWSVQFMHILNTNPFLINEEHLSALFVSLTAQFWHGEQPQPSPEGDDAINYVVWFCRGIPAMLDVMATVNRHLHKEFTWRQYADIMRGVVASNRLEADAAPVELSSHTIVL